MTRQICRQLTGGAVMALILAYAAAGATVSVDSVRQRYPWNGLVDIDYTVTLAEQEMLDVDATSFVFKAVDEANPSKTNGVNSLDAPLSLMPGRHQAVWNAAKDGLAQIAKTVKIVAAFETYPVSYLVIDLAGGHQAEKFDVTYLTEPPAGGFNTDEYKTTKIAFRLIRPGTFVMGSPLDEVGRVATNEMPHTVTITQPYYMALFEFTNGQYDQLTSISSSGTRRGNGALRPFTSYGLGYFRGNGVNPTAFKVVGELGQRTGLAVELPTEAQWEWACRAGTTTPIADGQAYASTSDLATGLAAMGRFADNANDATRDSGLYTDVGSYAPNAWGLYDMHGNAWETVHDKYVTDLAELGETVDPLVTDDKSLYHVMRGGCYGSKAEMCRSAVRSFVSRDSGIESAGFRLMVKVQ